MRTMNGGYAMINLVSETIYADVVAALASNKPIVVYEATGAPYYADSVTTSGTNVVITKGGKTITIANDNTITNVGDIQPKQQYYYYFDVDDGNITDGQKTVNHYMEFISDIKGLEDLEINEFTHLVVNAINSEYDNSGDVLNILQFDIYYNSNDNKLRIAVYQDGSDVNDFTVEFTTNPISSL